MHNLHVSTTRRLTGTRLPTRRIEECDIKDVRRHLKARGTKTSVLWDTSPDDELGRPSPLPQKHREFTCQTSIGGPERDLKEVFWFGLLQRRRIGMETPGADTADTSIFSTNRQVLTLLSPLQPIHPWTHLRVHVVGRRSRKGTRSGLFDLCSTIH